MLSVVSAIRISHVEVLITITCSINRWEWDEIKVCIPVGQVSKIQCSDVASMRAAVFYQMHRLWIWNYIVAAVCLHAPFENDDSVSQEVIWFPGEESIHFHPCFELNLFPNRSAGHHLFPWWWVWVKRQPALQCRKPGVSHWQYFDCLLTHRTKRPLSIMSGFTVWSQWQNRLSCLYRRSGGLITAP